MTYRNWLMRLPLIDLFRVYYESGGTLNPSGWARGQIVNFIVAASKAGAR